MDVEDKKKQRYTVKSYQETNKEIAQNERLRKQQPMPQPKDMEEIDY